MKRSGFQLTFPTEASEKAKGFFRNPEVTDGTPLTSEEINLGLAGLFRALGSCGSLDTESALDIAKAFGEVTKSQLDISKEEYTRLKIIELQRKLNMRHFPSPPNEFKPEDGE